MQAALKASTDFIAANEQAGTTGEPLERTIANQVNAFINMLRHMPYDIVDATFSMQLLTPEYKSCFSPRQKQTMISAIQKRAENEMNNALPGSSSYKQTHLHGYNYYPAYVWDGISDKVQEDSHRCDIVIEFNQKVIGLKYPDP
jgi:hypothetical protein